MTKNITKMISAAAVGMAALMACGCSGKKFQVSGAITEARDSMLYLEQMSLSDGIVPIDSARLGESGEFAFTGDAPDAPEFYRLRIADQTINLSIDSTEAVSVKAAYATMATDYEVNGSENCQKIKELALKQIGLQNQAMAVQRDTQLGLQATADSIDRLVQAYKEDVKRNYIFREPMKAYSYFALFQTLGNRLIFNPRQDREDIKVFAAVATSWDSYYPEALRGKNLHNIAIEGMKNVRIVESQLQGQGIDASKVNMSNIINIALLDNRGQMRSLTDLKGQVVLLDFHVFATRESTERIMQLRDIYNRYHARGLEIYQVSLDPDEHFWKTQTAALPWVSVWDADGSDSKSVQNYNVQTVPTFFLIDRSNSLYKRDMQIRDLDAEIQKLL